MYILRVVHPQVCYQLRAFKIPETETQLDLVEKEGEEFVGSLKQFWQVLLCTGIALRQEKNKQNKKV